jgi:hypothetical protein
MEYSAAIGEMSEGNPGAIQALVDMGYQSALDGHPLGQFYAPLGLDGWGIYGTDIYILWNDLCDRDPARALAVIEATQYGDVSPELLKKACARQDRSGVDMIDVEKIYEERHARKTEA